jgi:hypothetical protein
LLRICFLRLLTLTCHYFPGEGESAESRDPAAPRETRRGGRRPVEVRSKYANWIGEQTFNLSPAKLVGACRRIALAMAEASRN